MSDLSIGSIILAAGLSSRFGQMNKLLHEIEDTPIVVRVVQAHLDAGLNPLIVLGHESENVSEKLKRFDLRCVVNPDYKDGMGSSIAAGIDALKSSNLKGISICPGDLPWLKTDSVRRVIERFVANDCESIVIPQFELKRGHPVAFPKRAFDKLASLRGEEGGRSIIGTGEFELDLVDMDDSGVCRDMDVRNEL